MSYQSPLAKARGSGSAKHGVHHWWQQRITALLLIPAVIWLIYGVFSLAKGDYFQAIVFFQNPVNAGFGIVLIATLFYHTKLGLQVVVEDYVHTPWLEMSLQLGIKLLALAGVLAGALAILKVTFGD